MKTKRKNCKVFWVFILIVLIFSLIITGCANVQHQAKFDQNYKPPEVISVKVARVSNDTGLVFENDIEKLLVEAFEENLNEKNLLCEQGKAPSLFLESYIIKYREGSAFKRWLLPGWGATELSIRCDLKDENNNLVGSAVASREIFAGGLYTIGAWKTVFKDVTDDVTNDLRDQLKAKGYVVKSRQEVFSTVGTQQTVKAFSETDGREPFKSNLALSLPATPANEIKVNENEPWTGSWQVKWYYGDSYILKLKQNGKYVKSMDQSSFDLRGTVNGNYLRGWLQPTYRKMDFVIEISQDKMSFKGDLSGSSTPPVKSLWGTRKE
jgi:hypothetical protein